MTHIGLSSNDAQQQLQSELRSYTANGVKVNWFQAVKRLPHIPVCSLLMAISGLFLVAEFGASEARDGTRLFQGVFLLALSLFNLLLFYWEVYILQTRRIRNLLSKINPILNQSCPWTSRSYPKSPVYTLRGHFTVPAYRDDTQINLPTSLLVRGDVIELHEGVPSPAKVTLLSNVKSDGEPSNDSLDIGEFPPSEWFKYDTLERHTVSFSSILKPLRFKVISTPIISLLGSTVGKNKPKTSITKERNYALIAAVVLVAVVFSVTFIWNIIRYFSLPNDFDNSLVEMLLAQPVNTILPLLFAPLPSLWIIMNLYGTACLTLLVKQGSDFAANRGVKRIQNVCQVLLRMLSLIFQSSHHPNYRAFHILGSLTSVCAVDKEYLLTGGFPMPEKVFFLRTEEMSGERGNKATEGEDSEDGECSDGDTGCSDQATGSQVVASGSHLEGAQLRIQISSPFLETSSPSPDELEKQETSTPDVKDDRTPASGAGKERPVNKETEPVSRSTDDDGTTLNPPHSHNHLQPSSDVVSTTSSHSETPPFEVVTEILDLSANPDSVSGISFDDVNWQRYIGSLKPIGVNLLATSHFLSDVYSWCPVGTTEDLRQHLHKTSCTCPFGVEVGVTDYSTNQFQKQVLLYGFGEPPANFQMTISKRANSTYLCHPVNTIQPHVISLIMQDHNSDSYLLMSRGSGEMVTSCCSDFWDGKDLQPMTDLERNTILDFFNRRTLTSYCIALSYSPLLGVSMASLKNQDRAIYIPTDQLHKSLSSVSGVFSAEEGTIQPTTAPQVFGFVLSNQVFLGLLAFQFKPKYDVVTLIEDLQIAGIRFVHFTAENEVRGKIFAQKLGLEADWNCHISLAPAEDNDGDSSAESSSELGSSRSTSASSLSSFINANLSYSRARLPKGIERIRPHIQSVDNVPLLVPLFTDCTADTIQEMIQIMQENGEVVLCIGNAWNRENLGIFSQADISLSLIPEYVDSLTCKQAETCALSRSTSSQNASSLSVGRAAWPGPLELAAYLNSTTCQLCFHRDNDVSLLCLITESRHILATMRRSLLFGLGSFFMLAFLMFLATVFFLPPPLSGSHLFWFILIVIPLMILSFLGSPIDTRVKSQMPNRKRRNVWDEKILYFINVVLTFGLSTVVCLILFGLTLTNICRIDIPHSDCHSILGDQNTSSTSSWNGWRGEYGQGLVFAQDVVATFLTVYFIALSVRFIHRTEPLWKLWKFVSWVYITVTLTVFLLQLVYFAVSQSFAVHVYDLQQIAGLSSVPVAAWIIGFVWPFLLLPVQELLKFQDKNRFSRFQTHLKLEFETKLGMHSPM